MNWQLTSSSRWAALLIIWTLTGCTETANRVNESPLSSPHTASDSVAVSLINESHQALERGAVLTALGLADSAKHIAPGLADVHFARGRALSELKRFSSADSSYRKALSLAPSYRGARYNLGNNALRQGQPRQALRQFYQSAKTHPTPATYVNIGHAYSRLNKIDSARAAYRQALEMDSSYAPAHIMIGQQHKERGELPRALEHTQRAWHLEPDNVNYRYELGSLLLQTGRADEAISHLKSVVKEAPWHSKAHYNLGRALVSIEQREAGQQHLVRSDSLRAAQARIERLRTLALSKNTIGRWIELGHALRQVGHLEDATEAYNVALSMAPENLALRKSIANIAAMRGNPEEAIYRYHAILQRDSTAVDVWLNLGIAYTRIGNLQAAEKAWSSVLRYEPNHAKARTYLARLQGTQ